MISRFFFATVALALCSASAQTSRPVVVQAAPAANVASAAQPATTGADTTQAALQALQALKAANDAIIRQQIETLRQLDEIEKNAEQLKIFSKRG
jgi:hypothetical protein